MGLSNAVRYSKGQWTNVVQLNRGRNANTLPASTCADDHADKRHDIERRFQIAIKNGNAGTAFTLLCELKGGLAAPGLYQKQEKGQAFETMAVLGMVREAAKQTQLAPSIIDFVSGDYAQQIFKSNSEETLENLERHIIDCFCGLIKKVMSNGHSVYVRKTIQYIEANLNATITLENLSKIAGVSQEYFTRRFCQEVGMTVRQYIAKRRCQVAANLLIESGLSIQEISIAVGYEDSNYFSRVFKTNMGTSPQDYRKCDGKL